MFDDGDGDHVFDLFGNGDVNVAPNAPGSHVLQVRIVLLREGCVGSLSFPAAFPASPLLAAPVAAGTPGRSNAPHVQARSQDPEFCYLGLGLGLLGLAQGQPQQPHEPCP